MYMQACGEKEGVLHDLRAINVDLRRCEPRDLYARATCIQVQAIYSTRLLQLLLPVRKLSGSNMVVRSNNTHGRSCEECPHDRFLQLVARGGRRA